MSNENALLEAQQKIISQQAEQIELLKELAESRRLAHMFQTKELAELRRYHHVNREPWGFFWWLVFRNIWPFSKLWS